MSAKQDSVYTRTPAQLEQKQGLGKRFAEVIKVATDARTVAEDAKRSAIELDKNLTSEEVFNRLTENGELQGLFRGEDGELYINAEFIRAVDKLFANDIEMTGTFTQTASAFIEPTEYEWKCLMKHLWGGNVPTDSGDDYSNVESIPSNMLWAYDFDEDGQLTENDANILLEIVQGDRSIEEFPFAEVSDVTVTLKPSNPTQFIKLSGFNMWGHSFTKYIGVNGTNIINQDTEQKLNALSQDYIVDQGVAFVNGATWDYEKWASGKLVCNRVVLCEVSQANLGEWGTVYESPLFGGFEYPFSFVNIPIEHKSIVSSGGYSFWLCSAGLGNTNTTSSQFCLCRASNINSDAIVPVKVAINVVGKWK